MNSTLLCRPAVFLPETVVRSQVPGPGCPTGFERDLLVLLILQILIRFLFDMIRLFLFRQSDSFLCKCPSFVLSCFVVSFFVSLLSYACLLAYSVFSMHRQLQGRSTIGRGKSF